MNRRTKRYYRALLFEELQTASGDAFQHLFGRYMGAVFGDDFTQVRPSGSLGDGGCDGYRNSTHTVYQCYGKNVSAGVDSAYIVSKIGSDFRKAMLGFPGDLMREWTFAHNIKDGFPHQAVILIQNLEGANNNIAVRVLGPDGIERLLFALDEATLDDLFSLADRYRPLYPQDVQRLLKELTTIPAAYAAPDLTPVPLAKIDFNGLTEPTARAIRDNMKYVAQVEKFVRDDPDPAFGDSLARALSQKYVALRAEGLEPDAILDAMVAY